MTNELNETTRIVNLPMAHIVYGPPPAKPATKRNWFWAAAVLGASLWGFSTVGCGDNNAAPADAGACGGVTFSDGKWLRCYSGCEVGTLVSQPGLDDPAICVTDCAMCNS